jgi:hypothetical protein
MIYKYHMVSRLQSPDWAQQPLRNISSRKSLIEYALDKSADRLKLTGKFSLLLSELMIVRKTNPVTCFVPFHDVFAKDQSVDRVTRDMTPDRIRLQLLIEERWIGEHGAYPDRDQIIDELINLVNTMNAMERA